MNSPRYDFDEGGLVPHWKRFAFGRVIQFPSGKALENYVMVRVFGRVFMLAWPTDYFSVNYVGGAFYTRQRSWRPDDFAF